MNASRMQSRSPVIKVQTDKSLTAAARSGVADVARGEERARQRDGGSTNWLLVEDDGGGGGESRVRKACERMLHHSSCIASGGLSGGGGEAEAVVEARVASTVLSLSCWVAVLRDYEESGSAGESSKEAPMRELRREVQESVLQSILESRESKDSLDWNTMTAGLLSQVVVATGKPM